MNTLRLTIAFSLFGVVAMAVAVAGCDNDPPPGRDAGGGRDSGMMVDSGPLPDTGPIPDTGVDSGGGMGRCTPAGGTCDFIDQDCPDGEACIGRVADMPSACVPAGVGTDGTPCNPMMAGECAEGYDCAPDRFCRQICCPDSGITTCSEIGYLCSPFSGGFGYCLPTDDCELIYDPAMPTCPDGQACLPASGGDGSLRCTALVDMIATGSPCEFINTCELGSICVNFGDGGTCREFCTVATGAECAAGEMCQAVFRGITDVGACIPM